MEEQGKPKRTPEQERYVASFKEAMRAIDTEYKKKGVYGKAYLELVRRGMWHEEYIAHMYVLICGKLSPLSARLRNYILMVGALAHKIHDKAVEAEKKQRKDGQDNQAK